MEMREYKVTGLVTVQLSANVTARNASEAEAVFEDDFVPEFDSALSELDFAAIVEDVQEVLTVPVERLDGDEIEVEE